MGYTQAVSSGYGTKLLPATYEGAFDDDEEDFEDSEFVTGIEEKFPELTVAFHCDYRWGDFEVLVVVKDTIATVANEDFNPREDELPDIVEFVGDEEVSQEGIAQLKAYLRTLENYDKPQWFQWAEIA